MFLKLALASVIAGGISLLGVSAAFADTPTPSATATTTVTSTPTKTPTATPLAVPDAAAFRDSLLSLALGNLDAQAPSSFEGFFPAWRQQYPRLEEDGSAIVAKSGAVSVYYNNLINKGAEGPQNPTVIAFAVGDASGRCAGAVIYGYPKADKSALVASPSPCTGQAVKDAFALTFQAPGTPTATPPKPSAPLPPATGSGISADGSSSPLLFAVVGGLAALLAGASLGLRRRGRSL